jgi:hypothetical protein
MIKQASAVNREAESLEGVCLPLRVLRTLLKAECAVALISLFTSLPMYLTCLSNGRSSSLTN